MTSRRTRRIVAFVVMLKWMGFLPPYGDSRAQETPSVLKPLTFHATVQEAGRDASFSYFDLQAVGEPSVTISGPDSSPLIQWLDQSLAQKVALVLVRE